MSNSGLDSLTPDTEEDSALVAAVSGIVSMLTLAVGFGLLALGVWWFWIAFPIGFGGVLPAAIGLTKLYQRREETTESAQDADQAALDTLRERYARGEIDEAEFEHRAEALLETESVEDAAAYVDREKAAE